LFPKYLLITSHGDSGGHYTDYSHLLLESF